MRLALSVLIALVAPATAAADVGTPALDRPTPASIGIRLPVTGDGDRDATATVRYRASDSPDWRDGPALFRVHPEHVRAGGAAEELAGSLFGLEPATAYEVELRVTEPGSGLDRTIALIASTAAVPRRNPARPRRQPVRSVRALRAALAGARPGDVIELEPGVYRGSFSLQASGTRDDPIVLRGRSRTRTVLDGRRCRDCNILETYGSHVHVEDLTIRHGFRGFKNQGEDTEGLAVRRVRILDTTLGIGVRARSFDSYLCDNVLRGRLRWPRQYAGDGGRHASDEGIVVWGAGHTVCHNDVAGYGDALNAGEGDRADDFYGNEVRSAYDNGMEFDFAQGNVRLWENRIQNAYSPISTQPVNGGPAYIVRNVAVNMVDEPLKFHANGEGRDALEPSGMLVWNNTFVSPTAALLMQTPATAHDFDVRNNLFVGPRRSRFAPFTVVWTGGIDNGTFDGNGYWPNGEFQFGDTRADSFAELQQTGIERNGTLLSEFPLKRMKPLTTWRRTVKPADATPKVSVPSGLGAVQRGQREPHYGPR